MEQNILSCSDCLSEVQTEDQKTGDIICIECGLVLANNPVYLSDYDQNLYKDQIEYSNAYNLDNSLAYHSKNQEEKESELAKLSKKHQDNSKAFYQDGIDKITSIYTQLYEGEIANKEAMNYSIIAFRNVVEKQKEEKKNKSKARNKRVIPRKKYSLSTQYIMAAIKLGLQISGQTQLANYDRIIEIVKPKIFSKKTIIHCENVIKSLAIKWKGP